MGGMRGAWGVSGGHLGGLLFWKKVSKTFVCVVSDSMFVIRITGGCSGVKGNFGGFFGKGRVDMAAGDKLG